MNEAASVQLGAKGLIPRPRRELLMTLPARHLRCPKQVLGWIPWYEDGGLSDGQRSVVDAHASKCPECRAELDLVAGAAFEIDVELPDLDRSFAAVAARIAGSVRNEPTRRGRSGDSAP
jgi:anti-sigma factor RsiW